MNPKYRALIWEQRQVSVAVTGTCLLVAAMVMAVLWVQSPYAGIAQMNGITRDLAESTSALVAIGMSILAAILCVLGFDARGHLNARFDMRLARLPVRTLPIVTIALTVRSLALLALGIAMWWLYTGIYPTPYAWPWALAPAGVYLVLQSLAWARQSITGLSYPIAFMVGVPPMLIVYIFGYPDAIKIFFDFYQGITELFLDSMSPVLAPLLLLFTFALSWALAFVGVHWLRRDERHGPTPPAALLNRWRYRHARKDRPFASALDAQLWYEWKRSGWMLPGLSALILIVLVVGYTIRRGEGYYDGMAAQLLPYLAVILAAPIAGLVSGVPSYRRLGTAIPFTEMRPLSTAQLANAKLMTKGRSLFITIIGAFVLSTTGYGFFGFNEWTLIFLGLGRSYISHAEVLLLILSPALFAGAMAWVLLWPNMLMFILSGLLITTLYWTLWYAQKLFNLPPAMPYSEWAIEGTMAVLIGTVFSLVFILACVACWWKGAAPNTQIRIARIAWLLLAAFVAFRQFDFTPIHVNILLSLAVAAPLAWPLVTVPFDIKRSRHR